MEEAENKKLPIEEDSIKDEKEDGTRVRRRSVWRRSGNWGSNAILTKDREKEQLNIHLQRTIDDMLRLDEQCLEKLKDAVFTKPGSEEFAELVSSFYQHHGKMIEFAAWLIKQEVQSTKDHLVLFREDTFTINLINTMLFGDLGRRFLTLLIQPLVRDIIAASAPIEISEDKVGKEEAEKNFKILCDVVSNFLETFQKSAHMCPIFLREIFVIIEREVNEKFGTNKFEAPIVLDFIFFKYICPAIIDPQKYELIVGVPNYARRGLILASKLLNDIAHNTPKNRGGYIDDMWDNYIIKNHKILLDQYSFLTDEKNIEYLKSVIRSSVLIDEAWLGEQRVSSSEHVKAFLSTLPEFRTIDGVQSLTPDSTEMFDVKIREFMDKVNDPNWKRVKQHKEYTVFAIKDKNTSLQKLKVESMMDVPALVVADFLRDFGGEQKINPMLLDFNVTAAGTSNNYEEIHAYYKMPFPLNNRDMVIGKWNYIFHKHDDETTNPDHHRYCSAAIVYESVDSPREKGFVRGVMHVCGYHIEPLTPTSCRITAVFHIDQGGSIPLWVINFYTGIHTDKVLLLKKWFESNQDDKVVRKTRFRQKSISMPDFNNPTRYGRSSLK